MWHRPGCGSTGEFDSGTRIKGGSIYENTETSSRCSKAVRYGYFYFGSYVDILDEDIFGIYVIVTICNHLVDVLKRLYTFFILPHM